MNFFPAVLARESFDQAQDKLRDRGNLAHRSLIARLLRHPAASGIPRNDVSDGHCQLVQPGLTAAIDFGNTAI
jgi:hypothetical protein